MKIYDFSAENPIKKYSSIDNLIQDGNRIIETIIDSLNTKIPVNLYVLRNKYTSWQMSGVNFLKFIKVKDDYGFFIRHNFNNKPELKVSNNSNQTQNEKKYLKELKEVIKDNLDSLRSIKQTLIVQNKKISTLIEKGFGYLIFHNEKILIGPLSSGKFKLVETLCSNGFHKGKTLERVFSDTKPQKDKNKKDNRLDSLYEGPIRKIELLKNQIREINRAINKHATQVGLKDFNYRLTLKSENNTVWIEQTVGQRG